MSQNSFADLYRKGGFNPDAEAITRRSEAFSEIKNGLTHIQILDCIRIYFDLPPQDDLEWLRLAFSSNDPSFSLVNNAQEVRLLAAVLLHYALDNYDPTAALGLICTHFDGLRSPTLMPELITKGHQTLQEMATEDRRGEVVEPAKITTIAPGKSNGPIGAYDANPGQPELIAALKSLAADGRSATSTLAGAVAHQISSLASQIAYLHEEQSMLWWTIGGQSGLGQRMFKEIGVGPAAILAGAELATFVATPPGPNGAPALLQRVLASSQQKKGAEKSITAYVSGLSEAEIGVIDPSVDKLPHEIVPIHSALAKAREIGPAPNWHMAFEKAAYLPAAQEISPLQAALQTYRERLLLISME